MTRQSTPQVASARPSRTPLGKRNRLSVKNVDPAYHYRIVNANLSTDPDRVQDFIEAGYELVPQAEAGQIGDKRVGSPSALGSTSEISVGQGTKAVLMRIRKDWYQEDQTAKQHELDELEATTRAEAQQNRGEFVVEHDKR